VRYTKNVQTEVISLLPWRGSCRFWREQVNDKLKPMNTEIRRATAADLDALASVIREAADWLIASGMPMWTGPAFEPPAIAIGLHHFFLAFRGSDLAGVVRLDTEDLVFWPDIAQGESLFVHRLAVRRAYSGKKISTQLLEFARVEALQRGLDYLRLDCAADRPKLRKVYEDFGFCHRGDLTVGSFTVARYEYKIKRT